LDFDAIFLIHLCVIEIIKFALNYKLTGAECKNKIIGAAERARLENSQVPAPNRAFHIYPFGYFPQFWFFGGALLIRGKCPPAGPLLFKFA
jgi:hypothetical protein